MITAEQEQIIKEYFQKIPEVSLVYLFGSQSTGKETKTSDIDIAVLFSQRQANSFLLQGRITEELKGKLQTQVDVANLNASDVAFSYRVLSEGTILYEKNPDTHLTFQTDCTKRYFDLKRTYDQYYQELEHRAAAGTIGR